MTKRIFGSGEPLPPREQKRKTRETFTCSVDEVFSQHLSEDVTALQTTLRKVLSATGLGRTTIRSPPKAQKFANVVEADITRGEWLDPLLGKETFGGLANRWVPTIAGLTPKTRESYESILRRHLLPRFDATPVNRIDHAAVVALLAELTAEQRKGPGRRTGPALGAG